MPEVRRPRALRPGDRIAVVAPASPFHREELVAGLAELRALGFEPSFDERLFERRGYVAGTPELRAAMLRAAWRDPQVAGVVAARGGYGSVQVLPLLDADEIRSARKPFVGYSDLTSLLTFITGRAGLVAFHGPTVAGRLAGGEAAYDRASFLAALCEPRPMGEIGGALEALRGGEAGGPLAGGTLTQLAASLGTPFAFDPPAGAVLLVEEVNERPYRIDRLLTQLRLAGVFRRASAVVFGELRGCDEPGGGPTARAAAAEALADFPGPVFAGLATGHTTGPALTLPLGVRCRVAARPGGGRLVVEEAAVDPA